MKIKKNYPYFILLFLSIALIAQATYKMLGGASGDYTTVSVEHKIVDVGKIEFNSSTEAAFLIMNTGEKDLKILDVTPDCQCTVAEYDRFPIPPKQVASIKARYHGNVTGYFQKNIRVEINSKETPIIILTLRGKVLDE